VGKTLSQDYFFLLKKPPLSTTPPTNKLHFQIQTHILKLKQESIYTFQNNPSNNMKFPKVQTCIKTQKNCSLNNFFLTKRA
jgi:hypothetical protein